MNCYWYGFSMYLFSISTFLCVVGSKAKSSADRNTPSKNNNSNNSSSSGDGERCKEREGDSDREKRTSYKWKWMCPISMAIVEIAFEYKWPHSQRAAPTTACQWPQKYEEESSWVCIGLFFSTLISPESKSHNFDGSCYRNVKRFGSHAIRLIENSKRACDTQIQIHYAMAVVVAVVALFFLLSIPLHFRTFFIVSSLAQTVRSTDSIRSFSLAHKNREHRHGAVPAHIRCRASENDQCVCVCVCVWTEVNNRRRYQHGLKEKPADTKKCTAKNRRNNRE